jgi:very-short-patch-repair endonuclease
VCDDPLEAEGEEKGKGTARQPFFYFCFAMENYNHYNRNLRPNANALRKRMTKAEACLWKYALSKSKMKGYVFNRQRPVLIYIADFMCKELDLVIEVDGGYHLEVTQREKDAKRQADLENTGFTVLRFTNEEVLKRMNMVIEAIEHEVLKIEQRNQVIAGK